MVATKILDAVARIPENDGEDDAARKAYLQVFLKDHEGNTQTWIELPEDQWPNWWKGKFRRPCVRLLRNAYGHKLAGLYWERHCDTQLCKCGFVRLQGWECMCAHVEKQLLLSVYVDDLKLAGKKANIKPIWDQIGQHLRFLV